MFYIDTVEPNDLKIEYDWFEVGVLDHEQSTKNYFVQKVNSNGRIVDIKGKPVVNGGFVDDGVYKLERDNYLSNQ